VPIAHRRRLLLERLLALLAAPGVTPACRQRDRQAFGPPQSDGRARSQFGRFTRTSPRAFCELRLGLEPGNSLDVPQRRDDVGQPAVTPELLAAVAKARFSTGAVFPSPGRSTWGPHELHHRSKLARAGGRGRRIRSFRWTLLDYQSAPRRRRRNEGSRVAVAQGCRWQDDRGKQRRRAGRSSWRCGRKSPSTSPIRVKS